jgi:hypothetical protein
MKAPVIKNVIIRREGTIATKLETKYYEAGEVVLLRFASENEFRAMLPLGVFVEHDGPAPAYVRSTPIQPIEVIDSPAPQVVAPQNNPAPVVGIKSRKCENCRTMLILTSAQHEPEKQILFCPNCNVEEPLELPQPVTIVKSKTELVEQFGDPTVAPKDEKPPKKVASKCKCGGIKAAKATLCKKCLAAEIAAFDGEAVE